MKILKKIKIFFLDFYNHVLIHFNKKIGKQYIPDIYKSINIENTSICNLGCKFCGYHKRDNKIHPLKTMTQEDFEKTVKEVIALGYRNIGLSPTTGDVFMDKRFIEKLHFLENQKKLDGYYFYTNFIPLKKDDLLKILKFKKLDFMGISIYGHDLNTFIKFADSTKSAYKKLLENLKELNNILNKKNLDLKILIGHRTEKNFEIKNFLQGSDLVIELNKLKNHVNVGYQYTSEYNNWGGMIEDIDVKSLNINLNKKTFKKNGSCSLIYSRMIIGSNGEVNACACRDANYSLSIGNIFKSSLNKILSSGNSKYLDLIERQEKNDFPDVCSSCDFYTSIYSHDHHVGFQKKSSIDYINLKKFKDIISSRQK